MLNDCQDLMLILGPPGTGKTTTLLSLMEAQLKNGVEPEEIGFVSFTNAAADEAKNRACNLLGCSVNRLPYFRTIHSLCFKQLGLSKDSVFSKEHEVEFGDILGLDIKGNQNVLDGLYGMNQDDRYLFIENQSRIRKKSLKQMWHELADDGLDWNMLERVGKSLEKYKKNNNLFDFTDMLQLMLKQGTYPKLKVLFVDEAQDLSALQWDIIDKWANAVDTIYVAGDDDQAIHAWAGADVERFSSIKCKTITLDQSFRINRKVHMLSSEIIHRVNSRISKQFKPKDYEGTLDYYNYHDEVDISQGEWLLLSRNGYALTSLEKHCEDNGYTFESRYRNPSNSVEFKALVAYEAMRKNKSITENQAKLILQFMYGKRNYDLKSENNVVDLFDFKTRYNIDINMPWYDALNNMPRNVSQYFRTCLRNKEKLFDKPRIKISTIHGAKGAESQNVLLLSDISQKTFNSMEVNEDNEHRVFYVGCTRAILNLSIVMPNTKYYYSI